jgi:hypothetical protein
VGWGVIEGTGEGNVDGVDDGEEVGGLVYSTTMVDVDTDEPWVAFLPAVILMPVIFALAVSRAFVKLPLLAADDISAAKVLVRLATLPLYSVANRRPSLVVRVTTPSRRTSSVKCTSISSEDKSSA